jgi:aspartyl-tRNA(Asn)/glutamyl-tRNA(Gln) amidotransferase subunit B
MSNSEKNYIEGATGPWELVVGLEVHAQVMSKSKLFSGASTAFGAAPNTQVSLVDAALPGMLPVINEKCIEQAVRTGLGLRAQINAYSVFDRKNYFYPDLPQGYQISQYKNPIVGEGAVTIDLEDGSSRDVAIERLHLEQDAGKLVHDLQPRKSHVDLNRTGIALMEIVTKPDMYSSEEAGAFLRKLRTILRFLGTCDGNMEQGSMRADVNVSVRRPGEEFGIRTETKNVNSIRFAQQVIDYEAHRQIEVLEDGGSIDQETLLFDPDTGTTRSMRSKEEAHDYRYFPCPDLLPLKMSEEFIENIRATLPELPDAKKDRYMNDLGLSAYDAGVLVADRDMAVFFEDSAAGRDAKVAANWVMGDFLGQLSRRDQNFANPTVRAEQLGGLLDLIADGTISNRIAKDVLDGMFETGHDADRVVEEKGLKQVSDTGAIEAMIDEIMVANPEKVEEFRSGKEQLIGWFVGQVMQKTQGKANPKVVNELLRGKLAG